MMCNNMLMRKTHFNVRYYHEAAFLITALLALSAFKIYPISLQNNYVTVLQ